ncbi:hypothetical protein SF06_07950 [Pseudomonas flexibilis]|uniref:Peptidase MA superfamily protein n=1 Tax=Pseudomonas flexibilis TaxID=706570 RepID=A0A1N6YBL6_9PSED|nr:hypothetical protein [Pseudomonas flexibilis]KHL70711.1 hypothetical protein SF06_07950 [Pseudomonas flexibilis]SIR11943.1 hypothetical protein SAMN05421672_1156 [Pseudomonas flexibilis]
MLARSTLLLSVLLTVLPAWAAKVDLDYRVKFLPAEDQAEVSLTVEKGEAVHLLDFNLGEATTFSDFQADGQWRLADGRGRWQPSSGKASLRYRVRISNQRSSGSYDARMTEDWVLMRGDDLVPPARASLRDGVELISRLQFDLPEGWKSVETGWTRIGKQRFRVDNPSRNFDRPTGWLIAGKLGTRRERLGLSEITVAAPLDQGMRRMDILTLLTFVWPQVQQLFQRDPAKLLIVGGGEPMWRGGLSGPNSLFMHADRPLVSENGTSSLLHELVHVIARVTDHDNSDWISEGLAEYYAIELLRRAGGMTEDRYQQVRKHLADWSKDVKSLRGERASGPVTARAVLLLQDLDGEIRKRSNGQRSLDDVMRGLMRLERASTQEFIDISENVMGGRSKVLDTRLLR